MWGTHVPHHPLHFENSECLRNHYQRGQRLSSSSLFTPYTRLNHVVRPACRFHDMLISLQFVSFCTPPFRRRFKISGVRCSLFSLLQIYDAMSSKYFSIREILDDS